VHGRSLRGCAAGRRAERAAGARGGKLSAKGGRDSVPVAEHVRTMLRGSEPSKTQQHLNQEPLRTDECSTRRSVYWVANWCLLCAC